MKNILFLSYEITVNDWGTVGSQVVSKNLESSVLYQLEFHYKADSVNFWFFFRTLMTKICKGLWCLYPKHKSEKPHLAVSSLRKCCFTGVKILLLPMALYLQICSWFLVWEAQVIQYFWLITPCIWESKRHFLCWAHAQSWIFLKTLCFNTSQYKYIFKQLLN